MLCRIALLNKEETAMSQNQNPPVSPAFEQLADWSVFYRIFFPRSQKICSSVAPPYCPGFDQLILLLGGITAYRIIVESQKRFAMQIPPEVLAEIKAGIPTERRNPEDYAVWARKSVESDRRPSPANPLSINKLNFSWLSGMTLSERLILGLFHFWKKYEHLDQRGATLCLATHDKTGRNFQVTHEIIDDKVGRLRKKTVIKGMVFISLWTPEGNGEIPNYLGLREVRPGENISSK